MSAEFRVARLEYVLGCLLSYLHGRLGGNDFERLLLMLRDSDPVNIPAYLRKEQSHESGA